MIDLDRELAALGTIPVEDRWDDIVARAGEPEPMVIEIGPLIDRRSRRLLAVAAVVVLLAGLALFVAGRDGDDGSGVATVPPRAANEPALLDFVQPVQASDRRAVEDVTSDFDAARGIVLGQPTGDGYRHLIAIADPAPEGFDSLGAERGQWLLDDPVPGSDLLVTEVEGRTIVQGRSPVGDGEVVLASIAPLDAVRDLIRDLDRVPSELGETVGPWEVVELSAASGGPSAYAEVTTTIGGAPAHLVSNPASYGGPLGTFAYVSDTVRRVDVDGRTAWFGPRLNGLTWAVPGGGSAILFAEGTADELVAIAETIVERTPEEWVERGGFLENPPPAPSASPEELVVVTGDPATVGVPTWGPRPEIDGWTVEPDAFQVFGVTGVAVRYTATEPDGRQLTLSVAPGRSEPDLPADWETVVLGRDGITVRLEPGNDRVASWLEPGVGVVQLTAPEVADGRDIDIRLDVAEAITFVEDEVPRFPAPEPQPFGEPVLTRSMAGSTVRVVLVEDHGFSLAVDWRSGRLTTPVPPPADGPMLQFASMDGTAVVAIAIPERTEQVTATVDGGPVPVVAPIESVADGRIALMGLDPSANGQVTIEVIAADRTWTFDLPTLPMGWVDGVLTPTG